MEKPFVSAFLGLSYTTLFGQIIITPAIASNPTTNIRDRIVLIQTRSGQGSGVIIRHTGNTYTILTAAHVVDDLQSSPLQITTADQQTHTSNPIKVKIAPGSLDLATISFQSEQDYAVAELGSSDRVMKGQPIFAAGFQGKSLKFHTGTVVAISHQSQDRGYGLAIGTAAIFPGMSGGGLFNDVGTLIGINGKSVGIIDPNSRQTESKANAKSVSGLAIPIDTFKKVASLLNVDISTTASEQKSVDQNSLPPEVRTAALTADDFFITAGTKSQKGDYRGAIADYDRALVLNPQFGEVYFRRGIARTLIKDWTGAEADYTRAIAIKPQYTEAHLHRGNVRNNQNNWRGAKLDFDIALVLNPNSVAAHLGRGTALCELNDCKSGLQDYNQAITLNPNYAEAYAGRGFAYYRSGNRQAAIDNYMAAAELYRKQGKDREYLDIVNKIRQLVGR
jgi:Trypsin-like peptidase domain/TPR repeat/Tetratricopeptide repeat